MSTKNWIILSLSTVVSVLPQLLGAFDPYPKAKIAITVIGVLASGFLVQFKKPLDSTQEQK